MKEFDVCGAEFDDFASHFCNNGSNKNTCINKLQNWDCPLVFKKSSLILDQRGPGPCGLFASLEANIMVQLFQSQGECDLLCAVNLAILNILTLISDKYKLCTSFDIQNKQAHFISFETKDDAIAWMLELKYNEFSNACLLSGVSFAYAARNKEWYSNMPAPFVYNTSDTSMLFVFLMNTGEIDGTYEKQKNIAVKVCGQHDQQLNKQYFNPEAPIVIFLKHNHFFAGMLEGDNYLIFNTLGGDKVVSIQKDKL